MRTLVTGCLLESIDMVGILGLTHTDVVRGKIKQLAVMHPDDYGLLLRVRRRGSSGRNLELGTCVHDKLWMMCM